MINGYQPTGEGIAPQNPPRVGTSVMSPYASCKLQMRAKGGVVPRTCPRCGLTGRCPNEPVAETVVLVNPNMDDMKRINKLFGWAIPS